MIGEFPADADRLRRARRAFVRDQHPDRGGDPAAFADGLARFDGLLRESAGAPDRPVRVVVVRRPTGVRGWLRHLARRLDRHSRHRPPRVH